MQNFKFSVYKYILDNSKKIPSVHIIILVLRQALVLLKNFRLTHTDFPFLPHQYNVQFLF